jgi:hypothetical protein
MFSSNLTEFIHNRSRNEPYVDYDSGYDDIMGIYFCNAFGLAIQIVADYLFALLLSLSSSSLS